jgi:hypothetical protein
MRYNLIGQNPAQPVSLDELRHLFPLVSFPITGPDADALAAIGYEIYTEPAPTDSEVAADMEAQFDAYLDSKAQEKGFATRHTLAECASYPGPYHDMATAFGTWKDTCNAYAASVKEACLAGTREPPTMEQLLSELPTLVWPS